MKDMRKRLIVGAAILFIVIASSAVYAFRDQLFGETDKRQASNMSQVDTSSESYQTYSSLMGEDYDRQFLADMIAHHQGAVDMAELALQNAEHEELKDMARAIISAQESEIADMTAWQKEWGYPASSGEAMMDHSAMGMTSDMSNMTTKLEDKTGDAFDEAFLQQMIVHHQSAIDMAASGELNADHEELKVLTGTIVADQTGEIRQMEQWQKDWGYKE